MGVGSVMLMLKVGLTVMALLLLFRAPVANCIDDKCAACNAVAEELELGLLNPFICVPAANCSTAKSQNGFIPQEKPHNHLDMRHRLDSKGQRTGKLIDYRVSELRVVELLDGLCEKMQDYTLKKIDSTRREWVKVHDWDNITTGKQEARAYSKDISLYCGRLLEETEDELAELIKKGSVNVGDVSKVICQKLSKHCTQESGSRDEEGDDGSDDEL